MNAAVSDVSFEIYPGETLGLVGESGCGKSTVAKLLMGLEKLDAGEVYLEGQRIDQLSPAVCVRCVHAFRWFFRTAVQA